MKNLGAKYREKLEWMRMVWSYPTREKKNNMLVLPGGFARKFDMWGGVGVGMQSRFWKLHTCCMLRHGNVGAWTFVFYVFMVRWWCVHVYTWYVAGVSCAGWGGVGVGMQSRFWKLHTCCMLRHGNVGVWTFVFFMYSWYAAGVFMCTHGTLLVCHVQVGVGLGWGCNHVSGSCTHAVCYATATLVCELSVFYVFMVRCWCVHVYTWCVAGVSCPQQDAPSQTPPNSMHGKSCQMDTL